MEKGATGFFDMIAGTRTQVQESMEPYTFGTMFTFPV